MSIRDDLHEREDVDDDDIPDIIARADALQAAAKAEQDDGKASVDEVVDVARELDIAAEYVEAAIEEIRAERAPPPPPPEDPKPHGAPFNWALWVSVLGVSVLVLMGALAVLSMWLSSADSVPSANDAPVVVSSPPDPKPKPPSKTPEVVKKTPPKTPVVEEELPPTIPPETVKEEVVPPPPRVPLPKPDRRLAKAIVGDWILVSYHVSEDGSFFEVPLSRKRDQDPIERWHFRKDGTFRHIMSGALVFSGRWQVAKAKLEPRWLETMPEGKGLLLTGLKVRSSIPGIKRPEEHYWGVLHDDHLVLYYLGETQTPKRQPTQGSGFRRSWRGGWGW